jgi:TIR domain
MPTPTEIFLSHSSADHEFVARIGEILEAHGLPYWYSQRDILGAQQWHDEIGKALARCDWFLLILSPAAVASKWVKRELFYALRKDPYEGHIVVIDYLSADAEKLSWTLPDLQWVNFQQDFEDGCRELLKIWGKGYQALHR